MKQLLVVTTLLLFSSGVSARGNVSSTNTTNEKAIKVEVDHVVSSDRASNEIKVEKKIENQAQMGRFLSKKIVPKIQALPGVKSVQFVKGLSKKEKSWSGDYDHKRESHMIVQLDFVNPISMMFKVEEKFISCGSNTADDDDDDDDYFSSASSDCRLESTMNIEGPIAIYGNFAGTLNQELLFKNQLSVSFSYGMDYSRTDTRAYSYINANRMDFSRAIRKVVDWSQLGLPLNDPVRVTLVQAGRILKNINQELLKGK